MNNPLRGEIWLVQLDPAIGHEQAKTRPCLVISNNIFNRGPVGLFIAIPLTKKCKKIPIHIQITATESGLAVESFAMPEHVRSLSIHRYIKPVGHVSYKTLLEVEEKMKALLDFV